MKGGIEKASENPATLGSIDGTSGKARSSNPRISPSPDPKDGTRVWPTLQLRIDQAPKVSRRTTDEAGPQRDAQRCCLIHGRDDLGLGLENDVQKRPASWATPAKPPPQRPTKSARDRDTLRARKSVENRCIDLLETDSDWRNRRKCPHKR